ncbi:MAG: DUF819 family protein [Candidatus Eisenbacteria bacterium]|uniref:DUF819 family protein n=1 Tax=Eiseniibacteriota bacterium TaxID=2212470 RepID=A0A948W920_UNCEI|nr:DUF819 family protein [Candidatus Eisenbacteria bacterium]MBU1949849.1 DUF819 family protein [Candidatus Eisenbacteria bacterium]MBU2693296.1 DUF819 family protein [Candidatus Eisenbacteria bacterium]
MIQSAQGTLAVLVGIVAFFFFLEKRFRWRIFQFLPPLIWIYTIPVVLSNTNIISKSGPIYGGLKANALPIFITLMLLDVDFVAVVRVIGRGILVMLMGTIGVVIGAPIAYSLFRNQLGPEGWKGFGALAGSWIGGTGNMAAVAGAIGTPPAEMGLAVLADNLVYIVWLPLLLTSRAWAGAFQRFSKADPDRVAKMEAAVSKMAAKSKEVEMHHIVYLVLLGLTVAAVSSFISPRLPELGSVLNSGSWKVVIFTTLGILLSLTPARRIPGSQPLAMAIVYVFVASMGAQADLAGLARAHWFVAAAFVWITIHGLFCLLGALLFRVDIHTAAIASAANIGGAASAPIVASYHRETLIPVAVLMALVGYALGNYLGLVTAQLCSWVAG